MFLPIPSALMSDGTALFATNDAMEIDFHIGSQGYYYGVMRGTFTVVDAGDMFSGGVRYTQAGILRLYDATAGLPAGSVTLGGFAVSATGQLCVTTDAITGASKFIEGVAVQQDGTVHYADVSPVAKFRKGREITVTGAGVAVWGDVSGNDHDLLQTTDTNRPALQADGSILFDGADNFLSASFTLALQTTVYILFKAVTWTDTDYVYSGINAFTMEMRQKSGGVSPELEMGASALITLTPNLALGTYGVIANVHNGASSSTRLNNNAAVTGNQGNNGDPDGLRIGVSSGGLNFGNIQVKEVILYSGAHTTARQNWEINRLLAIT